MNNVIVYEPTCGCRIDRAAEDSLQLAKTNADKQVTFDFNNISLIVTSCDTVESILKRFDSLRNTYSNIYRESKEYKTQQEKQCIKTKTLQDKVDFLLQHLHLTKGNELALINWLGEFIDIADNIYLVWDKRELADHLIDFGYDDNTFLGLPKESYNNKAILAGWLVGQVIHHLKMAMPPHPELSRFCEKYKEL